MQLTRPLSGGLSFRRRTIPAIAGGVVLFLAACCLPNVGLLDRDILGDIPLYQEYGENVVDGAVPYRDFFVEYPPGALPALVLPTVAGSDYALAFKLVQAGLGALAVAFVAVALGALGASSRRLYAAVGVAALAPALLGTVTLTRYDLWPAALTAAALAALLSSRARLGLGLLGLAAAAKLYALALVPVALLYVRRRHGNRAAAAALAAAAGVFALIVLPFLALAPGGVRFSLSFQASRPLHIETAAAGVLLVAHHVGAYSADVVSSFNAQNLDGALPDAVSTALAVLQGLAVITVWAFFARGKRGGDELVTASAATVTVLLLFSKLLSPQYLVWLLPLVPLVGGTAGLASAVLLLAAFSLTQSLRFWDGVGLSPAGWVVFGRGLVLAALAGLLVAALSRRPRPP